MAIARAIVTEPAVLLADEPTGNLDTQRSHEIMELLIGAQSDHGITVLMVTHEADMAAYARRMVHFVDGRIADDVANPHPPLRHLAAVAGGDTLMLLHASAGAALDPPQPAALVPDHPRHRHRRQRGDHDGHARQRRHAGDQDADFRASAPTC